MELTYIMSVQGSSLIKVLNVNYNVFLDGPYLVHRTSDTVKENQ